MNVMEIREEVDKATSDTELQELLRENQDRITSVSTDLERAFISNDLESAVRLTAILQYWNRVDKAIQEKTEHID